MSNTMTPDRKPMKRRWFRRLAGDKEGVSAIEFTLIFPILVGLFAGTVDLGQALMVSRKMNQIVSSTADVVSQNSSWTATDVSAMLKGMATIIQPYKTSDLKIYLTVLDVNNTLQTKVNWSMAYNATGYAKNAPSPVPLPADMATANVQMVLVEGKFSFVTPFSSMLQSVTGLSKYTYNRYYFMRPRNSDTVTMN